MARKFRAKKAGFDKEASEKLGLTGISERLWRFYGTEGAQSEDLFYFWVFPAVGDVDKRHDHLIRLLSDRLWQAFNSFEKRYKSAKSEQDLAEAAIEEIGRFCPDRWGREISAQEAAKIFTWMVSGDWHVVPGFYGLLQRDPTISKLPGDAEAWKKTLSILEREPIEAGVWKNSENMTVFYICKGASAHKLPSLEAIVMGTGTLYRMQIETDDPKEQASYAYRRMYLVYAADDSEKAVKEAVKKCISMESSLISAPADDEIIVEG